MNVRNKLHPPTRPLGSAAKSSRYLFKRKTSAHTHTHTHTHTHRAGLDVSVNEKNSSLSLKESKSLFDHPAGSTVNIPTTL